MAKDRTPHIAANGVVIVRFIKPHGVYAVNSLAGFVEKSETPGVMTASGLVNAGIAEYVYSDDPAVKPAVAPTQAAAAGA